MNEASKFKKYQMWYKVKELISKHLNFEQISSIVGLHRQTVSENSSRPKTRMAYGRTDSAIRTATQRLIKFWCGAESAPKRNHFCLTHKKLCIIKQLTKKQLNEKVLVTCYGETETMRREDAIDFYYEGAQCCDGCEAERYWNIYSQLLEGAMHAYDEFPEMNEHCPHCNNDVAIEQRFEVQMCPKCLHPILPCSMCDMDKVKCSLCPL